jgi:hypothetical protein
VLKERLSKLLTSKSRSLRLNKRGASPTVFLKLQREDYKKKKREIP